MKTTILIEKSIINRLKLRKITNRDTYGEILIRMLNELDKIKEKENE